MFMGPRNWCQGMNSASLCSLAGRYENPIPPQCLAPIDFLKIPAQIHLSRALIHNSKLHDNDLWLLWCSCVGIIGQIFLHQMRVKHKRHKTHECQKRELWIIGSQPLLQSVGISKSLAWNWDSSTPSPAGECAPPPPEPKGGHTRLPPTTGEKGYSTLIPLW